MAYQMMKGKKGNNDGFPSIPGRIARYSASGLTNEQMKENPVWVDKTGNGHDLQMKNFLWGGMSGVGGYGDENYQTFYKFTLDDYVFIASPPGVKHMNFTFRVTGLQPRNKLTLAFFGTTNTVYGTWDKDGIYTVDADIVEAGKPTYFYNGYSATRGEFTIEILPLYPGFILSDGVDDFAVTEKELNFEDTYTVYTAFIPFQDDPVRTMALCGKDRLKDFYMYYSSLDSIGFFSVDKSVSTLLSNGFNLMVCKKTSDKMLIKNLITGQVAEVSVDDLIYNPGLYYLWRSATIANYSKTAIAGQIIDNGHFTTDEEDEKVLNWHKKQYSWLFPDQAWTVTGKTNEGTDRATIANITGNGNNLVLRNFGFAENSGYGSYVCNFNDTSTWIYYTYNGTIEITSSTIHVTEAKTARPFLEKNASSGGYNKVKIKVTGIKDGEILKFMSDEDRDNTINIEKDGIYSLPGSDKLYYGFRLSNSTNTYPFNCDITIEQIPDYEGYLVTDGVDDKIVSAKPITFAEKWTVVTDTIFLGAKVVSAGILVQKIFSINDCLEYGRVEVNVWNGAQSKIPTSSIKAISSDGKIYDADWNEYQAEPGTIEISNGYLVIATSHSQIQYCQIAFKNLGIYNNQILTKEDCIKAYNYLQTLKAK
jgi:hypothetical protein